MRRSGFTLLELLLALALLSMLMVALVNLLDTSLEIWSRTESERDLVEVGSSVLDLMARDLSSIEPGPRGDLLAEWATYDTDGDRVPGCVLARLRLVRRASRAELHRLGVSVEHDLIEVCWALLPDVDVKPGEGRSIGVLYRGERAVGDDGTLSLLDEDFFDAAGRAPAGSLNLVTGGVLWCSLAFATQTSIVHDGWSFGDGLADCATSWDAWNRGRPDLEASPWNEPGRGMAAAEGRPLLPRRVRIELEIERPGELRRRTRLAAPVETEVPTIQVLDPDRVPEPGSMILVDEEWMEVQGVAGSRVGVLRGRRGTRKRNHAAGAVVHHGWPITREVPIPLHREDWNL